MANFRLPVSTRNALVQKIQELLDAGAGKGMLEIRTGSQPVDPDDPPGGLLLGTVLFSLVSAPPAVGGTIQFSTMEDDPLADESGNASWARAMDSDGNTVFDCDVTAQGGGGTIEMNTVNVAKGGPIKITSFTITMPGE
jgi:hypothetical protein